MVAAASTSQISQPLWMGGETNLGRAAAGCNNRTKSDRVLPCVTQQRVMSRKCRHDPSSGGRMRNTSVRLAASGVSMAGASRVRGFHGWDGATAAGRAPSPPVRREPGSAPASGRR